MEMIISNNYAEMLMRRKTVSRFSLLKRQGGLLCTLNDLVELRRSLTASSAL